VPAFAVVRGIAMAGMEGQETYSGTIIKFDGRFGFIKPDSGDADMFVMPAACASIGGVPPVGTQVIYTVVTDMKTGRPRADTVELGGAGGAPPGGGYGDQFAGRYGPSAGAGYGPPAGAGYGPPAGAYARFEHGPIGQIFAGAGYGAPSRFERAPPPVSYGPPAGAGQANTGTFVKNNGKFGFIKQDNGEADMFVMPAGCEAYGRQLPPEGERVIFEMMIDNKTGRPRAENVQPHPSSGMGGPPQHHQGYAPSIHGMAAPQHHAGYGPASHGGGKGGKGGFGPYGPAAVPMYLPPLRHQNPAPTSAHTSDKETLFAYAWAQHEKTPIHLVMDEECSRMGMSAEEWQSRLVITNRHGQVLRLPVEFDLISDQFPVEIGLRVGDRAAQSHRQHADQAPQGDGQIQTGAMAQSKGGFGFIKQDSGDADMFVMPAACKAFGGMFPPPGTRMTYVVVIDQKTGRPRAEEACPDDGGGLGM